MVKGGRKKLKVNIKNDKKSNKKTSEEILEKRTNEDIEMEKIVFMRIGVACFMVIFFIVWIFNLKYQFKINSNNISKNSFDWQQTRTELDKTFKQIKDGMAQIKETQTVAQNSAASETTLTNKQIDSLKIKLMNEVVATSTIASTTATSTIINIK